jgi:hypothetical protein
MLPVIEATAFTLNLRAFREYLFFKSMPLLLKEKPDLARLKR